MHLPILTASSHAEALIYEPATTLTAGADQGGKKRIVEGLIIPWDSPGTTSAGTVTARRGSITIPDDLKRVKLFRDHSNQPGSTPVGYATEIVDTDQGLVAKFHVADTEDGEIALKDVTEGIRDSLSVELVDHQLEGDVITAGNLTAVALVPVPAFNSARVTNVTASHHGVVRAPRGISAKSREPEITAAAIYDAMGRLDDPNADATLLTAALKSMTTAKSPLEFAPAWVGKIWEGQPYERLFIPGMKSRELKDLKLSGYRWKTRPTVGEWVGAGTEVPSTAAEFEAVEVEAARLAGANKLPLEWVHFRKVDLIESYFTAMAEDYAIKSDNKALAAVVAAATEEDKSASQWGLLKAVAYANKKVKKVLRSNATTFAVNDEDYFNLIDLKEKELPALLALIGVAPENLKATDQVAKGKVVAWHSSAIEHGELAGSPIRVNAIDVAKGQTDEGVFGYVATLIGRPDSIAYVKFSA